MQGSNFGLIREGAGKAVLKHIPVPPLRDDEIIVEVQAIALNPTDWTTLEARGDDGTLVGCDFAGYVVDVGKDVKGKWKKGDRVAGWSHGGNDARPETGGFARYICAKGDVQFHVPDHVSFETACTVGVGLVTLAYGLYKVLGLPPPGDNTSAEPPLVLIYGGSTATGSLAIQFAKLSGATVVTTTSSKNAAWVKSLGADLVFDYRDPTVGKRMREATEDKLALVFDCVSLDQTAAICAEAIGSAGGKYCNLLDSKCPRADVESIFFLGYSVTGEAYIFEGDHYPADREHFKFMVKLMPTIDRLWAEGKFKEHPQRIEQGGLNGAIEGMRTMKAGNYSGQKLVYRVGETNWP